MNDLAPWVSVAVLLLIIILKLRIYHKITDCLVSIKEQQTRAADQDNEAKKTLGLIVELLQTIKSWAFIAQSRYKDAAAEHASAAQELKQVVAIEAQQPSRAEVVSKLEEVPLKTAEAVVEKLKPGDSRG